MSEPYYQTCAACGYTFGPSGHKCLAAQRDELLEALKAMVADFDGCYAEGEPAMIKARAAIAKAEG